MEERSRLLLQKCSLLSEYVTHSLDIHTFIVFFIPGFSCPKHFPPVQWCITYTRNKRVWRGDGRMSSIWYLCSSFAHQSLLKVHHNFCIISQWFARSHMNFENILCVGYLTYRHKQLMFCCLNFCLPNSNERRSMSYANRFYWSIKSEPAIYTMYRNDMSLPQTGYYGKLLLNCLPNYILWLFIPQSIKLIGGKIFHAPQSPVNLWAGEKKCNRQLQAILLDKYWGKIFLNFLEVWNIV